MEELMKLVDKDDVTVMEAVDFFREVDRAELYLQDLQKSDPVKYGKIKMEVSDEGYQPIDKYIYDCLYTEDPRATRYVLKNEDLTNINPKIDRALEYLKEPNMVFWNRFFKNNITDVITKDYLLYINYFVLNTIRTPRRMVRDALVNLNYLEHQFIFTKRLGWTIACNSKYLTQEYPVKIKRTGDPQKTELKRNIANLERILGESGQVEEEVIDDRKKESKDLRSKTKKQQEMPKQIRDIISRSGIEREETATYYTIYREFFNIITGGTKSKVQRLLSELKSSVSELNVDYLPLKSLDIAYMVMMTEIVIEMGNLDPIEVTELFSIIKWLSKHQRGILKKSELYRGLIRDTSNRIIYESDRVTNDRLRVGLKYIMSEPNKYAEHLDRIEILPVYKNVLALIYGVLRDLKGTHIQQHLVKILKSEEMLGIIPALYERCCTVDILNGLGVEVNVESILQLTEFLFTLACVDYSQVDIIDDIIIEDQIQLTLEELEEKYKELKQQVKEIRTQEYLQGQKEGKGTKAKDEEEIEVEPRQVLTIDFGMSLEEKKEYLSMSNFLLLKSDNVNIVSVLKQVRVESIENVSPEILKADYDAIVILTKGVTHADVFRVKSHIGDTPIIYTSRTNRRLIIEDMFNQF